jgi:hypothetical protein
LQDLYRTLDERTFSFPVNLENFIDHISGINPVLLGNWKRMQSGAKMAEAGATNVSANHAVAGIDRDDRYRC